MKTLQLKALSYTQYKLAIALIVLSIFVGAGLFLAFAILNDLKHLRRGQIVLICGAIGFSIFIIIGLILKFAGKQYRLRFDDRSVTIESDKTTVINYNEIKLITIWNNSDYSKIIIAKKDNTSFKLHVGFANLLRGKNILDDKTELDSVLDNQFQKRVFDQKGMEVIEFKNIR